MAVNMKQAISSRESAPTGRLTVKRRTAMAIRLTDGKPPVPRFLLTITAKALLLAVRDPWIEPAIAEVSSQIHEHNYCCNEKYIRLELRIVALVDRLDR